MTNQEILNKASMEYINLSEEIKKMIVSAKREKDEKEILSNLDILLQIMLMYVAVSNYEVEDIELSFIKLVKTECDIITCYNEKNDKHLTWDDLKSDSMEASEFKEFVDRCYKMFSSNINYFIIFLASIDSQTKIDELEYVREHIYNIMSYFSSLTNFNKEVCDYVMDEIFINKYKNTKSIFEKVSFNL